MCKGLLDSNIGENWKKKKFAKVQHETDKSERCKIYDSFVPEDGDAPKAMEGHRPEVAEIEKFLRENGINVNLTVAS